MVCARRCASLVPCSSPGARTQASHYGWRSPVRSVPQPWPRRSVSLRNDQKTFHPHSSAGPGRGGPGPGRSAKPFSGIADQRVETLQDPRFQKAGIKRYRIAVSYDQIRQGTKRGASANGKRLLERQDEFFRLAKQQRLDVMVSFYRTSMLSPKRAARSLPSVKTFQKDFRAFRKRYPHIKKFSNWNEINFKIAQPTGRNAKRAGQFYKMLRKECRTLPAVASAPCSPATSARTAASTTSAG